MNYSLSSFAPENLVSRDGFGGPISRQHCSSPYSRLNLVLAYGIPSEFRGGVYSLSVHIGTLEVMRDAADAEWDC